MTQALLEYLREKARPVRMRRLGILRSSRPGYYQDEIRPGLTESDLNRIELALGLALPNDVQDGFRVMDGMSGYTDRDAGWIRIWPLDQWSRLSTWDERLPDDSWPGLFVFADQGHLAWWYAIDLSGSDGASPVFFCGRHGPYEIARSYSEFVELVLDDSRKLHGPNDGDAA